ncbi:hypothetical protein Pfo_015710 [Paulownia fortunei]|nr:hypothetical protein Pfo_015710 [Paulownia fortunei]
MLPVSRLLQGRRYYPCRKVFQVWIAQGLVPHEGGEETMEEIARSFLDELVNRNMVQVKDMNIEGRVKKCYVHDLLRELSITKAKEEISFETLREGNSPSSDKSRHRAIYCSKEMPIYLADPNKHLRSLFFHGAGNVDGGPSFWKSFELLRVLDFEDFGLKSLPDTIGTLIGLRYLGLRNTKIRDLPSSLGCLKNLQFLDIARNIDVKVPNVIWKLASLRHLYMSEIKCQLLLKIDTLKNLQTLTYIPADNWTLEHPANMTSLHKLGIELDENSDVSKLCTSLAMLENLVCLNLKEANFTRLPSLDRLLVVLHSLTELKLDGPLTELPSGSNFPPNLSYLSLIDTSLHEDPMTVLEKLPKLLYLKLDYKAYNGEEMVISHGGFPRLKVLTLRWLDQLTNIQFGKGAMPELKRLEIYKCPHLKSLPEELRLMSNLQELKMVTTPEIASKLQGVDSHIISNIPFVDLIDVPYEDCFEIRRRQFVEGLSEWLEGRRQVGDAAQGMATCEVGDAAQGLVSDENCSGINESDFVAEVSKWLEGRRQVGDAA